MLSSKKRNLRNGNALFYSSMDLGWALLGIALGFAAVALARGMLQPRDALGFALISAPLLLAQHVWLGLYLSTGSIRVRACRWISAAANCMLFGIVAVSAFFFASTR